MTTPVAQIVDLGFSVADGERIRVSYENQTLSVSFVDWQEKPVSLMCRDTIAFRWQEAEYSLSDQERYDSTHEIIGSTWLRQHQEQGMTWEGTAFHHYKFNFNAVGILEMICSSIETIAEPGAPPNGGLVPTAEAPETIQQLPSDGR
jgi:hypothetical protein